MLPWAAEWQQHAEAQAVLEEAQASDTKDQISALEQAIRRLERVISLRSQTVPELRPESERLLTTMRAEAHPSYQQPRE